MSTNNSPIADAVKSAEASASSSSLTLKDLKYLFLPRWYWFVISVIICLGLGVLHLLRTPEIYTRSASILVKNDDGKSGASGVDFVDLSSLTGLQATSSIENDVFMLQSPDLMTNVVMKLGLADIYTVEDGLRTRQLYKNSPVLVTPADTVHPEMYAFTIKLSGNDAYELSKFMGCEDECEDVVVNGKLGEVVKTPVGNYILTKPTWETPNLEGQEISYMHLKPRKVAGGYAAALGVASELKQGSIITMRISDESPKKAEDILLALIEAYNEQWIEDRNRVAVSTSRFITERLAVIESELGSVDTDISSYKAENLLPDVQAAAALYFQQSAENKELIANLHNQLSMAEYVKRELSSASLTDPLPVNTGFEKSGIESQLTTYNTLVFERNRLLATTTEDNPVVTDKAATLEAMKKSLVKSVENLIKSLNTQLADIQKRENETRQELASSPSQAKYLLSVERQQKVKEALYVYLLQKREENELTQAFTAYNTRIITMPSGSDFPTSPRRSMVLGIAFLIGLIIPAAIIYLREMMNTRVRGRKDLEGMTLPFVGEIPQWGKKKNLPNLRTGKRAAEAADSGIWVVNDKKDIINEAFRVVRTNLEFIVGRSQDNGACVLTITSFNPGSGKTLISMNLAISLALKDRKVLVIDGDLRRGSMSRYVHSPKPGLGDWLGGYIDEINDIIVPMADVDGLNVIPVGTFPPNPAEVLENGRFGTLIEMLRPQYDYIIVDCPPVELVADTQIISRYVDRTIFVVRAGLMERAMLSEIENLHISKKYPCMSLLLNGTEGATGHYGYRYGYHYGYNYSYSGYYGNSSK